MSTFKAPVLPRHERAAKVVMRAAGFRLGGAAGQTLDNTMAIEQPALLAPLSQALANAEFEERVRCAWGALRSESTRTEGMAAVEDVLGEIADDADAAGDFWDERGNWLLPLTDSAVPDSVRDLVLKGWK